MFLTGNADVVFSSSTATTTPAVNLPSRAITADATSNATTVAATAALTVIATAARAASAISASALCCCSCRYKKSDSKRQARPKSHQGFIKSQLAVSSRAYLLLISKHES
jgi:hypothetical protein